MPERPPDPIELILRGLVRRERIANTASLEMVRELQPFFDKIEALIRRIDPTAPSVRRWQIQRREKLIREISKLLDGLPPHLERELKDILAPIGRDQALAAQSDLVASLGSVRDEIDTFATPVTQQRMRAILNTEPIRGRVLSEHTRSLTDGLDLRIRGAIRQGMIAEEGIPAIMRRVKRAGYARARREVEALTRTAVTHVSSMGQLETFRANLDVLEAVQFVATLDDRTTVICFSLDGEEWAPDSDEIVVPGRDTHYQCRSVLAPVPAYARLGLPEPPEGTRVARKADGTVGRIRSGTTAAQWLRNQSRSRVEGILGKGRAAAFLDDGVPLSKMIRDDFSTIPLDQLRGAA